MSNDNNTPIVLSVAPQSEMDDGGIQLKSVWSFIKLAFIRVVLFCAVAAILATFLVIIINQTRPRTTNATADIELVYRDADLGLLPNGIGYFNSQSIIGTAILDKAITDAGISDIITDIAALRPHLSVTAVTHDETPIDFFATRFTIRLYEPQELGLNEETSVRLLNAIINNFTLDLVNRHMALPLIDGNIFVTEGRVTRINNYATHMAEFRIQLENISEMLLHHAETNPNFIGSSGQSFSALRRSVNAILSDNLQVVQSFIANNAVTVDDAFDRSGLIFNQTQLNAQVNRIDERIIEIEDFVDNLPMYTVTIYGVDGLPLTTSKRPTELHTQLWNERNIITLERAELNRELANIAAAIAIIDGSTPAERNAIRLEAQNKIAELEANIANLIEQININLSEFTATSVASNAVRVVVTPNYSNTRDSLGMLLVVVIYAGFIGVAAIAALAVTQSKKSAAAKRTAAETIEPDSVIKPMQDKNETAEVIETAKVESNKK